MEEGEEEFPLETLTFNRRSTLVQISTRGSVCSRMEGRGEKEKREKGMDAKWTRYVLPSVTLPPSDYRSDTFELFRPCAPFRLALLSLSLRRGQRREEEGAMLFSGGCFERSQRFAPFNRREEEEEEGEEGEGEVCPVRDLA